MKPFIPVVRGLICCDEGILLLKRSRNSKTNPCLWELPGGKVKPGESLDEALIREINEETNLIVRPVNVMGAFQQVFPLKVSVNIIFSVSVLEGEVVISEEHEEYMWSWGSVEIKFSPWLADFLAERYPDLLKKNKG